MLTLLDLLSDCGITAKKVAGTHGGEYHSPCPVCGGKDRFHCWPERAHSGSNCPIPGMWGCRSCDASGDAIAFLRHVQGLSFAEACKRLGIRVKPGRYQPVRLPRDAAKSPANTTALAAAPAIPPETWMERNARLVAHAHEILLRTPSELQWLSKRGIDAEAVRRYRLGWIPGEKRCQGWYTRPLKAWGLPEEADGKKVFRFPRGLVIPRFGQVNGQERVIALRIRRTEEDRKVFAPESKYLAFKGSCVFPWLLLPQESEPSRAALVVLESELDAILVFETARRARLACGALALASNTAKPDKRIHDVCARMARLLIALDFDPADSKGRPYTDKALAWWLHTYPRARDWPVPQGKDPGEAYALGVDLRSWLIAGLPPCVAVAAPESAPADRHGNSETASTGLSQGRGKQTFPPEVLALYEAWCAVPGFCLEKREDEQGWGVSFRCDEAWVNTARENLLAVNALQERIMSDPVCDVWIFERNPHAVVTRENFFAVKP